jgi:hypothetical protein
MNAARATPPPIASLYLMRLALRPLVPVLVGLAALLLLAAPAAAEQLVARLYAPTHHPAAGTPWPIRITARDADGHRVRGTVRYAFLYHGEVVLRQDPKGHRHFAGDFRDRHFMWSKRTIGLTLTFRAIVDTKLGQANLDYVVRVHR